MKSTHSTPRAEARGMLRVNTERRFLPRFKNRGLAPSNVSSAGQRIFLAVHQGFQARYLLRTDILTELKKRLERIVILTPNADEDYFKREFEKDNVVVERFEMEKCEAYLNGSKGQRFFILIRSFVLNGKYDIKTVDDHYRLFLRENAPKTWRGRVRSRQIHVLVKLLRASKILRRLCLALENRLFVPDIHGALFAKYRPDMIVTTSLGNIGGGFDLFIMREAKRHGAKVVPIILSWDNTTGKGLGGVIPDHTIVWTEIMKDELVRYHDIPPGRITVGGIAHFDIYYKPEMFLSKERLFALLKLNPNRKLIFLATKSPTSYPWNADIVRLIAEAIRDGRIGPPAQLLVRLHPLHYVVKKSKAREHEYLFDEFTRLENDHPLVRIDRPEILSDRLTMDMPESEQVKLASILKHTDVLVNMFSTVNIEAAILDVPLVNVVFEGDPERRKKLRQSIDIDLHQTHNQRIVASGATRLCSTPEEMIAAINAYLKDRSLDKKKREALVEQEAGPHKGTAGKNIAAVLCALGEARA